VQSDDHAIFNGLDARLNGLVMTEIAGRFDKYARHHGVSTESRPPNGG
jgi:hypothetical protein